MRSRVRFALAGALALAALPEAPARACGGCFQRPDAVSTVTDHRMVVALSNQQTTLWDQIQYTGAAGDFVWVLPTPKPATVELASEGFFDTLERYTAPRIFAPPMAKSQGSGCQAPFPAAGGAASAAPAGDDVTVYHQGQVGPYETATVGSDSANALETWLGQHGYFVPDAMKPTIAWYVSQKWVFNALRLKPDATTSQMTPVRVVFPGLAATFPLRMVAAGAGPTLGVLLWVISDQRYAAGNYDTVTVDETALRWSTSSLRSNYRELFAKTLSAHAQGAFITEFAEVLDPYQFGGDAAADLAVAQVGQARSPWLTRLRSEIAPALLTRDLLLTPSASGGSVSNDHYLNASQSTSDPFAAATPDRPGGRGSMLAGLSLLAVLALALGRRARRA